MRTVTRIILGAVLVVVLGVSPASAEWYVGGYAGAAIPFDEDADVSGTVFGFTGTGTLKDVELEASLVFGGKVGYFFEGLPGLGLEVEGYHFSPDVDAQTVQASANIGGGPFSGTVAITDADIDGTAIVLNVIHRGLFETSADYPRGRLQPYVGVGGGVFMGKLEAIVLTAKDDDTDIVPGFQVLVGTKYFLTPNLAMFLEYKFLQTADFEFAFSEPGVSGILETDLTSHLIYGGIAWHF